jgi:hypothetical protein
MAGLTVLPAPASKHPHEMARWLRIVGEGSGQLLREIACWDESDSTITAASAWLATDLAALIDASADYLETGSFELYECSGGDERLEAMASLLGVGALALGDSEARQFVAAAIAERMEREREASA